MVVELRILWSLPWLNAILAWQYSRQHFKSNLEEPRYVNHGRSKTIIA